ncbi:MAG: hypothetical protein WCP79_06895 [Bacillota bacterium]
MAKRENLWWVRYIEKCIEDYHSFDEQIEEAWEILRSRTYMKQTSVRGRRGISRTTERAAINNVDANKPIKRLEHDYQCCKAAIARLNPRQLELLQAKYWTEHAIYNNVGLAIQLGYADVVGYYRMKHRVITIFAEEFGFINKIY